MQKPESLEKFIELIQGMKHRERYVFEAADYLKKKFENNLLSIEIYHTVLFETKNQDRNVTVHLVELDGTPIQKKARLLRLWNNDFYKSVYAMFARESSNEALPEASEVLELPE